jgi:nucleoside-diphosphate-sugar epimerase
MKFFVTGAAGYIGGSISQKLRDSGHEVLGLVRSQEKAGLLNERANVDHAGAVQTLMAALERSGKLLIHTSGSSIVADDACGQYASPIMRKSLVILAVILNSAFSACLARISRLR